MMSHAQEVNLAYASSYAAQGDACQCGRDSCDSGSNHSGCDRESAGRIQYYKQDDSNGIRELMHDIWCDHFGGEGGRDADEEHGGFGNYRTDQIQSGAEDDDPEYIVGQT
jgi:hypothetical protein